MTNKVVTPYDAVIESLKKSYIPAPQWYDLASALQWFDLVLLCTTRGGWLKGFQDGVEAVKADPDFYGLSSPTEGVRG